MSSTVLGLVGRDLLFDLIEAVVAEDAPAAFALADRAVERGYDLRLVCRELARAVRDMMIVSVDPARAGDGESPPRASASGCTQLAARFSREDLMRAFDLLAHGRAGDPRRPQPRYHFEMVLLRWMHLRKLVPLAELLEQRCGGCEQARTRRRARRPSAMQLAPGRRAATVASDQHAPRPTASSIDAREPAAPTARARITAPAHRSAPHGIPRSAPQRGTCALTAV